MKAMRLERTGSPLVLCDLPDPEPGPMEVRIRVEACAVCRTDLHVVDGDLPDGLSPVTPGHEIVGWVDRLGEGVSALTLGQRVGVGWLGATCRSCAYCRSGHENLCDTPAFMATRVMEGLRLTSSPMRTMSTICRVAEMRRIWRR